MNATVWNNPVLIKDIWGANGRNFFGAIREGNLLIPLQKVKFANKFCIANFIKANIYMWNRVRIRLRELTNFSKVCHKSTACVNKSASLKEHFFLGKLNVSFENVYNNMIGNIISFYRIFVLCNLDVWFRNYGKS